MILAPTALDLTIEAADGVQLAAHALGPVGEQPVTVVLVHGFAAHRNEESVAAVAVDLVDAGYGVLVFDTRGHGESTGECTLGDLEQHDVDAAVRWARARSDEVVVIGASMGAIATLRYAAEIGGADGYVTVSSPARWRLPLTAHALLASLVIHTSPGRRLAARMMNVQIRKGWSDPCPPVDLATRMIAPLAVVHGRVDRFLPHRDALELYRHAGGPRKLILVDDMGHAFDPVGSPAIREAVAWVTETARGR
ncbi:MAG: lysophospholipase [Actinobacteria bacterium]|nr:lysophospholipase [Actinomycetota bacterium]